MAGCLNSAGSGGGSGGGNGDGGSDSPIPTPPTQIPQPPPPNPAPTAAVYKRGSIAAPYQLIPRTEYGRFVKGGVQMADVDFQSNQTSVSASAKMDEIGALPDLVGGARSIIRPGEDRDRSNFIPFRGNPSDVKFL
jgi:hypothetical protein